ncbi:hypothetical protein RGR602_PC01447 (plasmid) [Rhizobium gallicum bv. gallicum R602sp]|uniref:Uncharacterized protein n=1 Tax=Rhizobium gallicum bv. gallicum R602sp TaxID=1041138 RepID=A0A0B4XFS6_9HYPH|nr:hypothetical protein RGR602_PC01447 [Rhizobium gallicum bv. gallicum R602sp]
MVQEPTDTPPQMREYSHKIKQYLGCLISTLPPANRVRPWRMVERGIFTVVVVVSYSAASTKRWRS